MFMNCFVRERRMLNHVDDSCIVHYRMHLMPIVLYSFIVELNFNFFPLFSFWIYEWYKNSKYICNKLYHSSISWVCIDHYLIIHTWFVRQCTISDKHKRSALTHSVMNGQAHVASFLLSLGSSPNQQDSSGNSPLHYAVGYGWYFCTKVLLAAGASPNTSNDWKVCCVTIFS